MDPIKKSRQRIYGIFLGTGFILGILIGIIFITLIVSYKIDEFHEQVHHLQSAIADREVRLQKLEEVINHRRYLVKDINIRLEFDGDYLERLSLEKALKDRCNILLGKEVKTIDWDLVIAMIDNRILRLQNIEYQAHVNRLVIAEVVQLWILVKQI